MIKSDVVVVGAGIAGLTSAAILSKQGLSVTLIESHTQSGGCAGTFKRKNYIFDVGATQVAGLEKGGIHSTIFDFLDIPSPEASGDGISKKSKIVECIPPFSKPAT